MSKNATTGVEAYDRRTVRAATEAMVVVPDAPGMFQVYSGETSQYTVDLVSGACECRDAEFNDPESGCKHLRRVEMEAGIREVPDLGRRTDVELMIEAREESEPDVEPEPAESITVDAKPDRAVATDGGQVLEEDALPSITTHVEPPEQGGAAYIRCEGCGREVIGTDERRLWHRDGCPRAEGGDR